MPGKTLLIRGLGIVIALVLGVATCLLAFSVIEVAWIAIGIGGVVAAMTGWKLCGHTSLPSGTQPESEPVLVPTAMGDLVDWNTPNGRATFAHDGASREDDFLEDD